MDIDSDFHSYDALEDMLDEIGSSSCSKCGKQSEGIGAGKHYCHEHFWEEFEKMEEKTKKNKHNPDNVNCPINDPETFMNPATAGLSCTCK